MKTLNQYIQEKLIINKDYVDAHTLTPESFDELRNIIEDRYDKLGPGTKQKPIDFNDIDVSNLNSFCNDRGTIGIFEDSFFKYIDISDWDVSKVTIMTNMFCGCDKLKSVGDISKWDVSNVESMAYMFKWCDKLKSVGDISCWDVSKVTNMSRMFCWCKSFNQDISDWDVSSVTDMTFMFSGCESFNQDISGWNISNVINMVGMFDDCPIKDEYKPKFK